MANVNRLTGLVQTCTDLICTFLQPQYDDQIAEQEDGIWHKWASNVFHLQYTCRACWTALGAYVKSLKLGWKHLQAIAYFHATMLSMIPANRRERGLPSDMTESEHTESEQTESEDEQSSIS